VLPHSCGPTDSLLDGHTKNEGQASHRRSRVVVQASFVNTSPALT
jgi:hypothetical protein